MTGPQMMAACPKYDAGDAACSPDVCRHTVDHEYSAACGIPVVLCPVCTPLPSAEQPAICRWVQEGDSDCWETSCDHAYSVNDGTPAENGMKFCTYCGKTLEQVAFNDEEEDVEDDDAADQPPRKTPRERIEEAYPFSVRGVTSMFLDAAEHVIAAADAREGALHCDLLKREDQIARLCKEINDAKQREDALREEYETYRAWLGGMEAEKEAATARAASFAAELGKLRQETAALCEERAYEDAAHVRFVGKDAIAKTCDEVAKLHEAAERKIERLTADKAGLEEQISELQADDDFNAANDKRYAEHEHRERLDRMVAALVGISNGDGEQCYDFKTAVADGAKILAAIDAYCAAREGRR